MPLTRDEGLVEVRDLINELTASFWTDAEIYRHLARGAIQAHAKLTADFLLTTHLTWTSSNTTSNLIALPADWNRPIKNSFEVGSDTDHLRQATEIAPGEEDRIWRGIFRPSYDNPYVAYYNDQLRFWQRVEGMLGTSQAYRLRYIRNLATPTAGTATYELNDLVSDAIVHFAAARCLVKKEADERAALHLKIFDSVIEDANKQYAGVHNLERG